MIPLLLLARKLSIRWGAAPQNGHPVVALLTSRNVPFSEGYGRLPHRNQPSRTRPRWTPSPSRPSMIC